MAGGQVRSYPGLKDAQPDFLQPVRLALQVAGSGLGQPFTSPQGQRLGKRRGCRNKPSVAQLPTAPRGQFFEMSDIDLAGVQPVSGDNVTIEASPPVTVNALRTRDTRTRSDTSTESGGSPSHKASISRSDGTTRPGCNASLTSSPRSLPP